MKNEPLIFAAAFDSLLRVWGEANRDAARATLLGVGVNIDKLDPAYPLPTWTAALEATARSAFPGVAHDEALYLTGRGVVERYAESLVGKALFGVLKVMGPARALHRLTRNLRSTNNFSEATVTERSPKDFEVVLNLVARPQFERGILTAGLELAGAHDVKVSIVRQDAGATYDVAWSS